MFIEIRIPRQDRERSCISMLVISILPPSTILTFDLEIVPTVCYVSCFSFDDTSIGGIMTRERHWLCND